MAEGTQTKAAEQKAAAPSTPAGPDKAVAGLPEIDVAQVALEKGAAAAARAVEVANGLAPTVKVNPQADGSIHGVAFTASDRAVEVPDGAELADAEALGLVKRSGSHSS